MNIRSHLPLILGLCALPASSAFAVSTFFSHSETPNAVISAGGTDTFTGTIDLATLSGIDLLSGQFLITDARFSFSYDQTAFMEKPLNAPEYQFTSSYRELVSAGPSLVDYNGTQYLYEIVFDHYDRFNDQQASATADLSVGTKTGVASFPTSYWRGEESAGADSFIVPDNTTGLIERHRYWNQYTGPALQYQRYFDLDPLGLNTDEYGVLSYAATATFGELELTSIEVSFHYEENPFWQPPATSAVPVPAAAWLFGSGLLGLVGLLRRR